MSQLFVVIYKEGNTIEGITNDCDLWLRNHNSNRVADGNSVESKGEFEFKEFNFEERTEENTPQLNLYMCNACHELYPKDQMDFGDDDDQDLCFNCN